MHRLLKVGIGYILKSALNVLVTDFFDVFQGKNISTIKGGEKEQRLQTQKMIRNNLSWSRFT